MSWHWLVPESFAGWALWLVIGLALAGAVLAGLGAAARARRERADREAAAWAVKLDRLERARKLARLEQQQAERGRRRHTDRGARSDLPFPRSFEEVVRQETEPPPAPDDTDCCA